MEGLPALLGKGPVQGFRMVPALAMTKVITLVTILLLIVLFFAIEAAADNTPPVAIISSPEDGDEFMVGDAVTFDGSQSIDEDPDNLTYEWNISGQGISGRDKAIVQRTFTTPGDVLVVLRVIDVGERNSTSFINIRIRAFNQAPVAIISTPLDGQRNLNGRTIQFDGSTSYDPDGGALVYRWETNRTIDPIGTLAILMTALAGVGIGWGKPVPVNPSAYRHPWGELIVSTAGQRVSRSGHFVRTGGHSVSTAGHHVCLAEP